MNSKNRLENRIRGWLPKDQSFQMGVYANKKPTQSSQSTENSEDTDKQLTKGQTKALVELGIFNLIMLISTSSYLVIYLITPSIWTSTLGLSLWVLLASIMLSVDYVLYRNYRKQTGLRRVCKMNSDRLRSRIRGWFPQEPFSMHSGESGKGKSTTTAYIFGYGVGLGIGEGFIVIVDLAGWTAIESSLSPPFDILSGMLVSFMGTMLALAIGAKLSRKLKEKWQI